MKNNIIFLLITTLIFFSCEEKEIEVYSTDQFIYFTNVENNDNNTIIYSFSLNPGQKEINIPLYLSLIGNSSESNRDIDFEIVESLTTASEENYELPAHFTFKANNFKDTIFVKVKNSEILKTEEKTLTVRLISNEYFKTGPSDSLTYKIVMHDKLAKPNWWNESFVENFLGEYSDKKFTLFMQVTGVSDFTGKDESFIRSYCLQFKYYLQQQNDQGNQILEEDGSPMVVTIVG